MTLTPSQIAALKELAEKATPGPWELSRDPDGKPYEILGMFNGIMKDPIVQCKWGSATKRGERDYQFIAACSPDVILSLIAANEKLAEALKKATVFIESFGRLENEFREGPLSSRDERAMSNLFGNTVRLVDEAHKALRESGRE